MALSVTDFRSAGFRIDAGIPDAVLNRSLTAAAVIAQDTIGDDARAAVSDIDAEGQYAYIVSGGTSADGRTLIGYDVAVYNIAYALLLRDNAFASVFGTTRKRDEYSENVEPADYARQWYAFGVSALHAVCRELVRVHLVEREQFRTVNVPMLAEQPF